MTVSSDKTVKIWDIHADAPTLVEKQDAKLGVLTCLASCPDQPFVFCLGGDNKAYNFKVWDMRESEKGELVAKVTTVLPAGEHLCIS